jgi:hypothetical protein
MGVNGAGIKKALKKQGLLTKSGGSGEIRTHERVTPSPVFKTGAFNHSATLPLGSRHYATATLSRNKIDGSAQW